MQTAIEMALKFLVFAAKLPSSWKLRPQAPFLIRLGCIDLFSAGPKLDNFCAQSLSLL